MGKPIDLIPSSSCRYPDDIPVTIPIASPLYPHKLVGFTHPRSMDFMYIWACNGTRTKMSPGRCHFGLTAACELHGSNLPSSITTRHLPRADAVTRGTKHNAAVIRP